MRMKEMITTCELSSYLNKVSQLVLNKIIWSQARRICKMTLGIMSTAVNRPELSNKTALISVNTKTKISHVVRSEGLSKIQMPG